MRLRFRRALLTAFSIQPLLEITVFRPQMFQRLFKLGVARQQLRMLSFQRAFALGATHQQSIMLRSPVARIPLELDDFLLA